MAPVMQALSIGRTQYRTAAGRKHPALQTGQFVNDGFLDIAKAGLSFPLEVVTDGTAKPLLDDVVGVEKGKLQPPGELSPDGGFTGAGEAD